MDIKTIIEKTAVTLSSVYPPEQALWLKHYKDLPAGTLIVDFGTGWGSSCISMALACPQARILTFDTGVKYVNQHNVEDIPGYEAKVSEHIAQADVKNIKTFIGSCLEIDPAEFIKLEGEKDQIDVLNIDCEHSYEHTLEEVKRWTPLVKKGGLICLHDWEHPNAPGVAQAWKELVDYDGATLKMDVWGKVGQEYQYDHTEDVEVTENRVANPVIKVKFLELAKSPIVTTALFEVI